MSGSKARFLAGLQAEQITKRDEFQHELSAGRMDTGINFAKKDQRTSGAAMTASGGVIGGTGLLAGGIPGAHEPKSLKVWHLKGGEKGLKSGAIVRPSNLAHNAKIVAPLPRGGILGFRADMHDQFIKETHQHTGGGAYAEGMRQGKLASEHKIVRGMRLGRRASYGLTAGGALLAAGGVNRLQGKKTFGKRDDRARTTSAALLAGGGTAAGVSHGVNVGLSRFGNKYASSSKQHIKEAQRLAPHYGGLQTTPAKANAFGITVKPARETMKPEIPNWKLEADGAHHKIKGGAAARAEVGRHRGMAAQERHFAEVFSNTARGFKRVRNPSLAVAAAGGTGLWASRGKPVAKRDRDTGRVAPLKTTIGEDDAKHLVERHGLKGPLPKTLNREQKMAAYEARYVSAGGHKATHWQHRANDAEKIRVGGVAAGTAAGASWLASRGKAKPFKAIQRKIPHLQHKSETALAASGVTVGTGELYGAHARKKRSSYASAPSGVAASALRRMRAYTPENG